MAVLNPLVKTDVETANDTDLAGPLVFCLLFGGVLLLVSSEGQYSPVARLFANHSGLAMRH